MTEPYQSDLEAITPALVLVDRLKSAHIPVDDLELVIPPDILKGVSSAYGIPVRHADLGGIYLAHKMPTDWRIPSEFDRGDRS